MNQDAKDNAVWTGIAALLMLAFGWSRGGWVFPADAGQVYRAAMPVFDWTLRLGGICLLGTAVVCIIGLRVGLLLDAIFSGLCGLMLILCTIPWLLHSGVGLSYVLYLIFGGMFINAARGCWASYVSSSTPGAARPAAAVSEGPPPDRRSWLSIPTLQPPVPPPKAEPPHPASIRPKSISAGGPPPPEGYLAALAKEDEEPPTAAHK